MEHLKKSVKYIKYIIFVLYPAMLFYITAYMTYDPFVRTRWKAQVLNLILFELFAVLLLAVTGSAAAALRIEILSALLVSAANYYVIAFRSAPIVPWDIFSIQTAASVAGGYSYALPKRQIILILAMLLMAYTARFAKLQLHLHEKTTADVDADKQDTDKKPIVKKNINKKSLRVRLITGILSLAALSGITCALWQEAFVKRMNLYPFLFTPTVMYERNGFVVTFLMDLQYMSVDKPDGYSVENAKELLDRQDGLKWMALGEKQEEAHVGQYDKETLPNVIVVMDEAFSDLKVLGDFAASEDYMPFLHTLQQGACNTVTGQLHVSVMGGNTANTEFEFLTGDTMAFLPAGSIPYQQYVRGEIPTLASYLKSLGYETVAMHPYYATGWNRDKVYPQFGFDTFYDWESYLGAGYTRKYVDDESCVDKIIETYENKSKDTPLFLFNVTMQNHSPYTDGWQAEEGNITVDGVGSSQLSEYLTLMKLSDAALEKLITYFTAQEEPTVILFFGDHQPTDAVAEPILNLNGQSSETLSEEEADRRYEVPYVIWANYDIKEAREADTSVNYLAAQMMEYAGIPLSEYQNYLLDVTKELPLISTQQTDDIDSEAAREYQMLQYYLLFDYDEEKE